MEALVLCYHAVSDTWPADLAVAPGVLERQLRSLLEDGFRGTIFTEAVTARPAGKTLAVTFDDAFRSVREHALPVLDRLGLPGTVFVPTAHAGGRPMAWPGIDHWVGGEHERELDGMTWDELRELAEHGWEVGSHSRTHPHLTQLADDALADELRRSREECERELGRPCVSLAYPYGDQDERVVRAASDAGYVAAAALPARPARGSEPLAWPRIGIYRGDGELAFRLKVSPLARRIWGSPAGRAVTVARRIAKPRRR
jgi:peptidoglycan/xylan/chitin deacetylase (PgdA/CDA1 family)